jgi:polysaccharide biosynthesis protein PslH
VRPLGDGRAPADFQTSLVVGDGLDGPPATSVRRRCVRTTAPSPLILDTPTRKHRELHTKALFLTTVLPSGRFTGSEVASQGFIDGLRRCGCEVSVLGYQRAGAAPARGMGEHVVGERPIETSEAGARAYVWMGSGLVRGLPYSSAKFRSGAYLRAARDFLADRAPELVVLDHANLFWLASITPAATPLVVLAHNLEHELYAAEATRRRHALDRWVYAREARLFKAIEESLATRAAEVWTLTEHDCSWFGRLGAVRARPLTFPCQTTAPQDAEVPKECDVCLLGSWTWGPNAEGLRWFMQAVQPLLAPDISVHVGGKGADWLRAHHPNVSYHGFVPDAQAFLRRARVVAVPSTRGAGIQIKTLDAIASGSAVVATRLALRGIEDPPRSVTVAETAEEFAGRIHSLVRGEWAQPDSDAVAWAEARSTRFAGDLTDALAELGLRPAKVLATR